LLQTIFINLFAHTESLGLYLIESQIKAQSIAKYIILGKNVEIS
jgi:hypothetical protein